MRKPIFYIGIIALWMLLGVFPSASLCAEPPKDVAIALSENKKENYYQIKTGDLSVTGTLNEDQEKNKNISSNADFINFFHQIGLKQLSLDSKVEKNKWFQSILGAGNDGQLGPRTFKKFYLALKDNNKIKLLEDKYKIKIIDPGGNTAQTTPTNESKVHNAEEKKEQNTVDIKKSTTISEYVDNENKFFILKAGSKEIIGVLNGASKKLVEIKSESDKIKEFYKEVGYSKTEDPLENLFDILKDEALKKNLEASNEITINLESKPLDSFEAAVSINNILKDGKVEDKPSPPASPGIGEAPIGGPTSTINSPTITHPSQPIHAADYSLYVTAAIAFLFFFSSVILFIILNKVKREFAISQKNVKHANKESNIILSGLNSFFAEFSNFLKEVFKSGSSYHFKSQLSEFDPVFLNKINDALVRLKSEYSIILETNKRYKSLEQKLMSQEKMAGELSGSYKEKLESFQIKLTQTQKELAAEKDKNTALTQNLQAIASIKRKIDFFKESGILSNQTFGELFTANRISEELEKKVRTEIKDKGLGEPQFLKFYDRLFAKISQNINDLMEMASRFPSIQSEIQYISKEAMEIISMNGEPGNRTALMEMAKEKSIMGSSLLALDEDKVFFEIYFQKIWGVCNKLKQFIYFVRVNNIKLEEANPPSSTNNVLVLLNAISSEFDALLGEYGIMPHLKNYNPLFAGNNENLQEGNSILATDHRFKDIIRKNINEGFYRDGQVIELAKCGYDSMNPLKQSMQSHAFVYREHLKNLF